MALDPKKRQKKLAKRKAQRKEKAKKIVVQQQQQIAYESNRFALAARYPIHQCLAPVTIFASGMGTVMVSRRAPNGDIVLSMFLLDTFCLGVKDAVARELLPYEYDEMVSEIRQHELLQTVEPSYARKLVEEAAAYAATLGFKPAPDYHTAKAIFGDIDASDCSDQFSFGKDGKPFYIAGPSDSPLKRQRILTTLEKNVGKGNFEYLMPIGDDDWDYDDYDAFDEDGNFDDLEYLSGDDEGDDDLETLVHKSA